ncbi:MAG: hypothetical protein CMF74_15845 [Maricaulis sp.]|nr:hypothetical protein [Maricaulis sp.]HAQ33770.1 hypothetical protein [Alphaproteobacteria bacterium]
MSRNSLVIWAVADTRRGVENQAVGLAEAVARELPGAKSDRVVIRDDGFVTLPEHDTPDLWIGCGRPALGLARRHRDIFPNARFVYVQDPRKHYDRFDLIVAPAHDRVRKPNAISMIGSPHRVSAGKLTGGREVFADQLTALPGPRAAVLIGGPSKRFMITSEVIANIMRRLDDLLTAGHSLMVSVSRRTPKALVKALKTRFGEDSRVWVFDGTGDNPYFAFLGAADLICVTEDSTNMLVEAASTGKPVYSLPLEGKPGKFARLYSALEGHGALRPFLGTVEQWDYPPLDATTQAAREVVRRLGLEQAGTAA